MKGDICISALLRKPHTPSNVTFTLISATIPVKFSDRICRKDSKLPKQSSQNQLPSPVAHKHYPTQHSAAVNKSTRIKSSAMLGTIQHIDVDFDIQENTQRMFKSTLVKSGNNPKIDKTTQETETHAHTKQSSRQ